MSSDFSILSDNDDLPTGWELTKMEDLVIDPKSDIVDGPFGSNLKASEYQDTGIPIIRLQNIDRNRFINSNIKFVSPEKAESLARHSFVKGNIAITKLGEPLGKACIIPDFLEKGIIVADIVRVRVDEDKVNSTYLTYSINSQDVIEQLQNQTKGTTRARVNLSHIREIQIPLPPLNEQRRIVEKIEALMARSRRAKEALDAIPKLIEQFRQSVLAAAFRGDLTADWREQNPNIEPASVLLERIRKERREKWEQTELEKMRAKGKEPLTDEWKNKYKEPELLDVSKLSELPKGWEWAKVEDIGKVQLGRQRSPQHHSGEYMHKYIRAANISWDGLNLSDVKEMNFPPNDFKTFQLRYGDILINEASGSQYEVGKPAVWREEIPDCCIQNTLIRVRPDAPISDFIFYLFYWTAISGAFGTASKGIGIHHLSAQVLSNWEFRLPPIVEQEEIVARIQKIFKTFDIVIQAHKDALIELETLNQSILSKAFRGELVEQDPNDEPASVLLERIQKEREKEKTKVKQTGAKKLKK